MQLASPAGRVHASAAVSAHARPIIATNDGVYLWPGIALLFRKGQGFAALDRDRLANLIGCFFGPEAIWQPITPALDRAAGRLCRGDVEGAQQCIDAIGLPPVSPNGWRLMRAIGKRLRLNLPDLPIANSQTGTIWDDAFAADIAESHDRLQPRAEGLAKLFDPRAATQHEWAQWDKAFNPNLHPRRPKGQTGGGEFVSRDDDLVTPVGDESDGYQIHFHHWHDQALTNKYDREGLLTPEARYELKDGLYADSEPILQNVRDPENRIHMFDKLHRDASADVKKISEDFVKRNGITPQRPMTQSQALDLLGEIHESKLPGISAFREALKRYDESLTPMQRLRVLQARFGRKER